MAPIPVADCATTGTLKATLVARKTSVLFNISYLSCEMRGR
jgi:hypothetical protein